MYQGTAHFYEFFEKGSDESAKRADFFSSFLPKSPCSIIDVGAGTGEIALLLKERGHRVSCFEPSADMYSILVHRLSGQNNLDGRISAFPCKAEDLAGSLQADLAFASSVFSHLSEKDRAALLEGLSRHLKPEGRLIFNCVQYVPGRPNKPFTKIGERTIGDVIFRHFDASEQVDSSTRRVTWKFEIEHREQILREYREDFYLSMDSPESIRALLEQGGFQMVECFGSFDRSPFDNQKPGLVVAAVKK